MAFIFTINNLLEKKLSFYLFVTKKPLPLQAQ